MIREPRFTGNTSFYPSDTAVLNDLVGKLISAQEKQRQKAAGIIVPHAGYVYSGKVAGLTYGAVNMPGKLILLGPNHTGMGAPVSIMCEGSWKIPGAQFEIDTELAEKIVSKSRYASNDSIAHMEEHSLEVQLPFIAHCNPSAKIVPIAMGIESSLRNTEWIDDIGEAVASAVKQQDCEVLLIASSDMSHYVSKEDAEYYDNLAIQKIIQLDHQGLIEIVVLEHISMCGLGPVASVLKACTLLGSTKAELIHYNTSAEAFGQASRVVGYAGLKIL